MDDTLLIPRLGINKLYLSPSGSPDVGNKDTMDAFFKSEGFDTLGFEESVWRSRHVDVKVLFLRDLVRDGHVKLLKYSGPQNVYDVLTNFRQRFLVA